MKERRIDELIAKKLAKEATEAELIELAEYFAMNPEEQYAQELLENWWGSANKSKGFKDSFKEEHFQKIITKSAELQSIESVITIDAKQKAIFHNPWFKYAVAASIVGIITIFTWRAYDNWNSLKANQLQENEIVAKPGTKSKLILPDGTRVWLNSESRITYNSAFGDSLREVSLEGEAYFDVVKNAHKPFIVHTSGISIRVLGTAFNVKSYPKESIIEATLVRGLIEVARNSVRNAPKIILRPNEKLTYNKSLDKIQQIGNAIERGSKSALLPYAFKSEHISISSIPKNVTDSSRIETSWVYGKLLFDGDSFEELAQKMERWFNVKINIVNRRVSLFRFTGVFEDENIEEALHALQITNPFKFQIKENEIIIDKK